MTYTPTTDEVRQEWQYGHQDVGLDGNVTVSFDEAGERFDRWYMSERRKWQAGTLRDVSNMTRSMPADPEKARRWLRDQADRIERGE